MGLKKWKQYSKIRKKEKRGIHMEGKDWINEDWIKKIYYGEQDLAIKIPETEEYAKLKKKIAKLSEKLVENEIIKKQFLDYSESVLVKESIEAEFQFELGFKVAVTLIFQALGGIDKNSSWV